MTFLKSSNLKKFRAAPEARQVLQLGMRDQYHLGHMARQHGDLVIVSTCLRKAIRIIFFNGFI